MSISSSVTPVPAPLSESDTKLLERLANNLRERQLELDEREVRRHRSRQLIHLIANGLAALFNVLIVIVVCFVVAPKFNSWANIIDELKGRVSSCQSMIVRNNQMLEASNLEMQTHKTTIARLNSMLDEAVKRQEVRDRDAREVERKKNESKPPN